MKIIDFLTSRGFAVFLLAVCIGILIVLTKFQEFYSPAYLIIPACLFISISFCVARRAAAGGRDWGSFVFHAGMLAAIAVTAVGTFTRFESMVYLPQDIMINTENDKFVHYNAIPHGSEPPFFALRLNKLDVRYEKDRFPVDYAAELTVGRFGGKGFEETDETVRVNAPLWLNGYQFLLVKGDFSPRFILSGSKGNVILDSFVNISNEIETEDVHDIPSVGLTLHTRFFPDVFEEDGKYGTRSPQVKNPAFGIRVTAKNDLFKDIWKGVLKPGERAEFNGMTFEFAELKPVVTIQITKDPTYWGIYAGWLLIVAGLVIRYAPLLIGKRLPPFTKGGEGERSLPKTRP